MSDQEIWRPQHVSQVANVWASSQRRQMSGQQWQRQASEEPDESEVAGPEPEEAEESETETRDTIVPAGSPSRPSEDAQIKAPFDTSSVHAAVSAAHQVLQSQIPESLVEGLHGHMEFLEQQRDENPDELLLAPPCKLWSKHA